MKVIYKYPLQAQTQQFVTMPCDAEILSVGEQNGHPFLWALVDTNSPFNQAKHILMFGTGQELDHPDDEYDQKIHRFIGTIHPHPFVFHIFEGKV